MTEQLQYSATVTICGDVLERLSKEELVRVLATSYSHAFTSALRQCVADRAFPDPDKGDATVRVDVQGPRVRFSIDIGNIPRFVHKEAAETDPLEEEDGDED